MKFLSIEISRDAVWSRFPVSVENIKCIESESKLCRMVSEAMLEAYSDEGLEECDVEVVDRMGTEVYTDESSQVDYVKQLEGDVYSRFNWVVNE